MNAKKNFNEVIEKALANGQKMLAIEKRNHASTRAVFRRAITFPLQVEIDLTWTLWSVLCLISRQALNDPLFDLAMKKSGCQASPCRNQLESTYLAQLDLLICEEMKDMLAPIEVVSLSVDGWSDRLREHWMDCSVSFVKENAETKLWELCVLHPDLIYVGTAATSDVIECLIRSVCSEFLSETCLIGTSTTDGAANERKAAKSIVAEGSALHCVGHTGQLCVHDLLEHSSFIKSIVTKAHSLVVLIRGVGQLQRTFKTLAAKKMASGGEKHYETLIMDVVTRWDSTLSLLERIIYFDSELLLLCADKDLRIPTNCILSSEEFDVARFMVSRLLLIRVFTKKMEYRNLPTLCCLPSALDALVSGLSVPPETDWFGLSHTVLQHARRFQSDLKGFIMSRFAWVFEANSLALAAALFVPGLCNFGYANFVVNEETKNMVITNCIDDLKRLCPGELSTIQLTLQAASLNAALEIVKQSPPVAQEDILLYWTKTGPLVPSVVSLVKMLMAIPATSCESERCFRSAGLVMRPERTNLTQENFRRECRLRNWFGVRAEADSAPEARKKKLDKAKKLLEKFREKSDQRRQAEDAHKGLS